MVAVSSSTVTEARRSRKLGAIGASEVGTNRSACTRSIALGRRGERAADEERDIGDEAEHHAVHERRQIEAEQRLRPQPAMPNGPSLRICSPTMPASEMLGKQQRIGPYQNAGGHAGDGAVRRAAPPDQSAEKRRRELRDGGKRQQPDRGKLRRAGGAVIDVGKEQDREDRDAAHQQEAARRRRPARRPRPRGA